MAKSSKPDKGTQRKTDKPKSTGSERTDPKYQKVVDEYFTNWPKDQDNPEDGDR